MALFKCKMCGGDVVPVDGQNYGTCDSCGTTMTLPTVSDERKVNLFNRANHFRKQNEFDKALIAYENILNEDNTDAEAHWGVLLCRYGIEYVEDPRTHEMTPTCHRVQLESILADADYLAALEHTTDGYTRSLYEKEAAAISKIQKGILAVSRDEQPYDVFICYKEASETGARTKDSTIAQDIYYQLEKAGYCTFFARITLEDKVGREYEPYIFSALHSAKVMLVIGTKPSYFNAVWVKNEWSRYLALAKKDKSRLLIPCYMDMDAYDLPEELSFLQSQDMSKIGFIQDLLRGIEKVLHTSKSTQENPSQPQPTTAAPGVDSLYRRGLLFLEDGDFKQADQYFDKVLDISPEYAPAYMGKYFAQYNLTGESSFNAMADAIITNRIPITLEDNNFRKALRFANPEDKKIYEGYEACIKQKNEELAAIIEEESRRAKQEAEERARKEQEAQELERQKQEAQALELKRQEDQRKEETYRQAVALGSRATKIRELDETASLFRSLGNYLDAEKNTKQYNERAKAAKRKLFLSISGMAAVICLVILTYNIFVIQPSIQYNEAVSLMEAGSFDSALRRFSELGNYKNSPEMINETKYLEAQDLLNNRNYDQATAKFKELGDYMDSADLVQMSQEMKEKRMSLIDLCSRNALNICATNYFTAAIKSDGTVVTTDLPDYEDIDISAWTDIIALYKDDMDKSTPVVHGLKSNGSIVTNNSLELSELTDMLELSSRLDVYAIGLKSDGTVVEIIDEYDQIEVETWTDIVDISNGGVFVVGLRSDGTVLATGSNKYGRCDVDGWTDIVAIYTTGGYTIGLKSDGTVISTVVEESYIDEWTDIVKVYPTRDSILGLKLDGTVVEKGIEYNDDSISTTYWHDTFGVQTTDIVALSTGGEHTLYLQSDGTVIATGDNEHGQCDVQEWTDIVAISAADYHSIGLKSDGTVVAAGDNLYGECDVSDWTDIRVESIVNE